jgi:hypothetical protein
MKVLLIIHKKVNCPTMGRKGAGINQGTILPTEKSILYKQKLGSLRRENKTKMYIEPSSASPFEGNVVHPMMLGAANKAQQQLSVVF